MEMFPLINEQTETSKTHKDIFTMDIKHGFMEMTYYEEEAMECTDDKCNRLISPDDVFFIDIQNGGKIYCKLCGTCERYHRKKEVERNSAV